MQDRLIVEIGPNVDFTQTHEMRKKIQQLFDAILDAEGTQLTRADRVRLIRDAQMQALSKAYDIQKQELDRQHQREIARQKLDWKALSIERIRLQD